jgi:hypothetical protein
MDKIEADASSSGHKDGGGDAARGLVRALRACKSVREVLSLVEESADTPQFNARATGPLLEDRRRRPDRRRAGRS